jgi:hypothetical protein
MIAKLQKEGVNIEKDPLFEITTRTAAETGRHFRHENRTQ